MRKYMKMLVIGSALCFLGCAQHGVQLYTVTADQLVAMRAAAGIPACPTGKTDIAGVVEFAGGGGEITVKCGLMK